MKRCKAETTRVCGSIACELAAEHEGAHEGTDGTTRAVWTNPNAPHLEPLEPSPALSVRNLVRPTTTEELEEIIRRDLEAAELARQNAPARQTPTQCACGVEHTTRDHEFRGVAGAPIAAWDAFGQQPAHEYAWARVCRGCGAVYCLIWSGVPSLDERPACTCPLSERKRHDFAHQSNCPQAATPTT